MLQRFFIFCVLYWLGTSQMVYALPDSLRQVFTTKVANNLCHLIEQNKLNDQRHESHLNQYVLLITEPLDYITASNTGRVAVVKNTGSDALSEPDAMSINNKLIDISNYLKPKGNGSQSQSSTGIESLEAYMIIINYLPVEFDAKVDADKLAFEKIFDSTLKDELDKTARKEFYLVRNEILKIVRAKNTNAKGIVTCYGNAYAVAKGTGAELKGGRRGLITTNKISDITPGTIDDDCTKFIVSWFNEAEPKPKGIHRANLAVEAMRTAILNYYGNQYVFEYNYTLKIRYSTPTLFRRIRVYKREDYQGEWRTYHESAERTVVTIRVNDSLPDPNNTVPAHAKNGVSTFMLKKKMDASASSYEHKYSLSLKRRYSQPYQSGAGFESFLMCDAAAAQIALEMLREYHEQTNPQIVYDASDGNNTQTYVLYEVHKNNTLHQPVQKNVPVNSNSAIGIDFTRVVQGLNNDDFSVYIVVTDGDAFSMLGTLVSQLKERLKYTKAFWKDKCAVVPPAQAVSDSLKNFAFMTGVVDGLIDEAFSIPELVGSIPDLLTFFGQYTTNSNVRNAVNAKIANMAPIESLIKAYSGNPCEVQYQIGKDLVGLASCFTGISAMHAKAFDGYMTTGIAKYKNAIEVEKVNVPLQLKQTVDPPLRIDAINHEGVIEVRPAKATKESKASAKIKNNEVIEANLEDVLDLEARRAAGEVSPPIRYKGKTGEPSEVVILSDGRVTSRFGRKAITSFLTGTGKAPNLATSNVIFKSMTQIGEVALKTTDNITDIFVHYVDGAYFVHMENSAGKFFKNDRGLTESGLADYIRKHLPQNDTPLRLNSCSDLESAKLFSKEFPNRDVYATDAIVNVHADGGITVTARPPSNNQEWRKLKNGEDVGNAPTPKAPEGEAVGKFMQLGFLADKYLQKVLSKNPNLATDVADAKNKINQAFNTPTADGWSGYFGELIRSSNPITTQNIENILEAILEKPLFAKEIQLNNGLIQSWNTLAHQGIDAKRLVDIIKDGKVMVLDANYNTMTELILLNKPITIALKEASNAPPVSYSIFRKDELFALDRSFYQPNLTNLPNGGVLNNIVYDYEGFIKPTKIKSAAAYASCTVASLDIALRANGKTPLTQNVFNSVLNLTDPTHITGVFEGMIDAHLGYNAVNVLKRFDITSTSGLPSKTLKREVYRALGSDLKKGSSYIVTTGGINGHAFNAIIRNNTMYVIDASGQGAGTILPQLYDVGNPTGFLDNLINTIHQRCPVQGTPYDVRIYNVTDL